MTSAKRTPVARVLGVDVDAIDMTNAIDRIRTLLFAAGTNYICVAGVHGVMEAQRSADLASAYTTAALTVPDGMPLVWVGHLQGQRSMQRVTGPDLMLEVFRRKEFAHLKHFLYGGDVGVAQQLEAVFKRRFPDACIVGAETPPFRELSPREETLLIDRVRTLNPDIIWIGLGCPRQELFMQRYSKLLHTRVMVGVGAAFDYHTGRIRDSADWVKKAGLQWVHRLIQDPRRLWKRYLRNNPAFIWRITGQLLSERITRPLAPAPPLRPAPKVEEVS
jgi:N-acetylglucosaminyldiphosphoundecaprenol N-acetyl-beta-D-mannosaminyltransferase